MINQWWMFGLAITELLIVLVLIIVISLIIYTVFLKMALIGWIPIIGCILSCVVISSRHSTGFIIALIVWLIAGLIGLIITVLIVVFIIGLIGIAIVIPFL